MYTMNSNDCAPAQGKETSSASSSISAVCQNGEGQTDSCSEVPKEILSRMKVYLDFGNLPRIRNGDLPGIGGQLKEENEFFNVTEIPLWEPDGKGNNAMVRIRRTGANTKTVVEKLAKLFGCKEFHIGYAGLKDRYATCTQTFSINIQRGFTKFDHALSIEEIIKIIDEDESDPILKVIGQPCFNSKKIRKGQLKGNRFEILITNLSVPLKEASKRVIAILNDIEDKGIPNYYGIQRIGNDNKSSMEGFKFLWMAQQFVSEHVRNVKNRIRNQVDNSAVDSKRDEQVDQSDDTNRRNSDLKKENPENNSKSGEKLEKKRKRLEFNAETDEDVGVSKKKFRKWWKTKKLNNLETFGARMKLNAFQSGVFNSILASRIRANMFTEDFVGDIVMSQYGGKPFHKKNEKQFSERKEDGWFTFTCPMIGARVSPASGKPKEIEDACLKEINLSRSCFKLTKLDGAYRPGRLSVKAMGMQTKEDPERQGIWFTFTLPKGSYATSCLREFM